MRHLLYIMARNIITGIDVGTYQVKVVIAEHVKGKDRDFPRIIGSGFAESKGLRHGYIINSKDVEKSIREAIGQAEQVAKVTVKHTYLSVGGVGLEEVRGKGGTIVTRADAEITDFDVRRALQDAEEKVHFVNSTQEGIDLAYQLAKELTEWIARYDTEVVILLENDLPDQYS